MADKACEPALALATMSKAMEIWTDNVDEMLRKVSEELARSSPIQEQKLASAFLGGGPGYAFSCHRQVRSVAPPMVSQPSI